MEKPLIVFFDFTGGVRLEETAPEDWDHYITLMEPPALYRTLAKKYHSWITEALELDFNLDHGAPLGIGMFPEGRNDLLEAIGVHQPIIFVA